MSEKNSVGRPSLFKNSDDLQKKIDEYFEEHKPVQLKDRGDNPLYDKNGFPIYELNPPTITGLALYLGFESRQSIYDYEKNSKFSYTIKRARLRCEMFVEENLFSGNIPASAGIFALKNYGWKDTHYLNDNTDRTEMFEKMREISESFRKKQNK